MSLRNHSDFSWIVVLIGCAFFSVGAFFLSGIIGRVHLAYHLGNAVEVQASVLEVELKTSTGGGRSGGGASQTTATYEFELAGSTFRSDRLSVFANSGSLYHALKQAKDLGQTVTCYVDPEAPSISVLHRDFALWPFLGTVLLALVSGGIGIACFFQEIRNLLQTKQAQPVPTEARFG